MKSVDLVLAICSGLSIIGLAFSEILPVWVRVSLVLLGVFCTIVLIKDSYIKNQTDERVCHNSEEIKACMKDIIKAQGKICIMSRDLSWVDEEIEFQLYSKGKHKSVIIFAENETDLTKRLSTNGVKIMYYGHLNFEPKLRFSVIRYNSNNPQVIISDPQNSIRKGGKIKHVIYESGDNRQDRWLASLALDLITLCQEVFESAEKKRIKV